MLISKLPDEDGGRDERPDPPVDDNSHEYQTANELFEIMARNQNMSSSDGDALSPRDLILLYKNIDIGTKLMSGANDFINKKPNQHVETVVYHDDPESEESDISDVYSNEDVRSLYLVNKERLDLFNIPSTAENKLCQKFGGLEIQTSDSIGYDKHLLFQDPFIKDQLKTFNLLSNSKEVEASLLPASLLDYVCCKRLEDNYNFHMDSIIRYVMNTIEQLKRISNGDYLTEKAKEKWREVEHNEESALANTKVLATSTSIPLHVECKAGGKKTTWDDIVHSEVDIRSLSKILEKKIFIEVPKFISGSFKLLSKCCADNLIISCKKDQSVEDTEKESRVDVVFRLKRSETGHVVSNISSIMILQKASNVQGLRDIKVADAPLSLLYKEINEKNDDLTESKVVELGDSNKEDNELQVMSNNDVDPDHAQNDKKIHNISNIDDDCNDIQKDDDDHEIKNVYSNNKCCPSQVNRHNVSFSCAMNSMDTEEFEETYIDNVDDLLDYIPKEACLEINPVDLGMTIHRLSLQSTVHEESFEDTQSPRMKKKALVRIKSPYENQSHAVEEKRRRKLLEVRERREKKKMALAENCKISKNKYVKGTTPTAQSSSSVTKLSITNKSFYNSIYGHSADPDLKQIKNKRKGDVFKTTLGVDLENIEQDDTPKSSPEANNKKYINRSYYLDDTETEMMVMEQKEQNICSGSTSCVSGEFNTNLNLLSQLMPSDSDANVENDDTDEKACSDKTSESLIIGSTFENKAKRESEIKISLLSHSKHNIAEVNFAKNLSELDPSKDIKKIKPSLECRKSIDKIYQLLNKIDSRPEPDCKPLHKQSTNASNRDDGTGDKGSISIQGSDSGTSLKHRLTSSNPSMFSFSKPNAETSGVSKASGGQTNVVPKVIISSKPQPVTPKTDVEKNKKDRLSIPLTKVPENHPLKAISQLLHEFENVQKNRFKSGAEQRPSKKSENSLPGSSRQNSSKRRSRFEQHNETAERPGRSGMAKDKRSRPVTGIDAPKHQYQQVLTDDKYIEKGNRKKHVDILDEVKEARGEAVRGPSKFTSRLNSLAQPKRTYVQAHSEEYQNRYGRNLISDRLLRLAAASPCPTGVERTAVSPVRRKTRRNNNDVVSAVSLKLPFQFNAPIERAGTRSRHSTSNSPIKERASPGIGSSHKSTDVLEPPEKLEGKMSNVESYIKNQFGRVSCATITNPPPQLQKVRAPPVPNNIDMECLSASTWYQKSTEVGSKLHRLISEIIKNAPSDLEVLSECNEVNTKSSKDNVSVEPSKDEENGTINSDFEANSTDGVSIEPNENNVSKDTQKQVEHEEFTQKQVVHEGFTQKQVHHEDLNKNNDISTVCTLEPAKPEHALCRPWSMGAFSKRLKIKDLKLTKDSSLQRLLLLQATDTCSVVFNTSIHSLQTLRTSQNSQSEKVLDLKAMPILSNPNFNWDFANLPLQMPTVGYTFPAYKSRQCPSPSLSQLLGVPSCSEKNSHNTVENLNLKYKSAVGCSTIKRHKICLESELPLSEQGLQTDDSTVTPLPGVLLCSSLGPDVSSPTVVPVVEYKQFSYIKTSQNIGSKDDFDKVEKRGDQNETCNDCNTSINTGALDYTTSLDILVGLLNEIKKITKSQTHITESEADDCNQLEIILNKADQMHNSNQSITYKGLSLTNLDKLRCLESNPSVYSYYLSDNDEFNRDIYDPWYEIKRPPIYADKEINVNIPKKEYVNRLTDVPSMFFPMTISHSTDATATLLAELCQTSAQSIVSYHSTCADEPTTTIIELPQIINTAELREPVTCCELVEVSQEDQVTKTNEVKLRKHKSQNYKRNVFIKKNVKVKTNNQIVNRSSKTDFDSVMRMKRDVLVTIYSMLVITVFAALSFPEVLYHM